MPLVVHPLAVGDMLGRTRVLWQRVKVAPHKELRLPFLEVVAVVVVDCDSSVR